LVARFLSWPRLHALAYQDARVSTGDQDLTLQLTDAGCTKRYEEKRSGAKRGRPELQQMVDRLRAGDVIVVGSLQE
jgi:DNA invertase Pin-like site-specific DNA recombinase